MVWVKILFILVNWRSCFWLIFIFVFKLSIIVDLLFMVGISEVSVGWLIFGRGIINNFVKLSRVFVLLLFI